MHNRNKSQEADGFLMIEVIIDATFKNQHEKEGGKLIHYNPENMGENNSAAMP